MRAVSTSSTTPVASHTAQDRVGTSGTSTRSPDRPGQPQPFQAVDRPTTARPDAIQSQSVAVRGIIDQRSTTALCSDYRFPAARRRNGRLTQPLVPAEIPVFLKTAKHDRGEHASHEHREYLLQHVNEGERGLGSHQSGITNPEFLPAHGVELRLFRQGGSWLQNRLWSDGEGRATNRKFIGRFSYKP